MQYRREIDGLRAVAVIPVILFHAGFASFSGGFVGVDVFFVISGYLITTIILNEKDQDRFSLIGFYERRARRILPALFLVMLACLPYAWLWLRPSDLKDFSQSLVAVSLFSSNFLFWLESGYFEVAAELKPLLHTWSLSVEEQYYVLFPLFLLIVGALRKRWILAALLLICLASLALAEWGTQADPVGAFFLLPTRAWELMIGAAAAFILLYGEAELGRLTRRRIPVECLGLAGLALILYAVVAFDDRIPYPSFYALVPTLGTALIILFATSRTTVGRLLGNKALVGIGLISYSAYLWHQPLFAFARHRSLTTPPGWLYLLLSLATIVLAYLSWRFVEMPFRKRGTISRRSIFGLAAAGSAALICVGLIGHLSNGPDAAGTSLAGDLDQRLRRNHGLDAACNGETTFSPACQTSDAPEIAVWGDSYAMHLVPGILASNPEAKIVQMTKSVCGPFFGISPVNNIYPRTWAEGCLAFNEEVRDWLEAHPSVKYVVLSSPFFTYLRPDLEVLVDGEVRHAAPETAARQFRATLGDLKAMGLQPVIFSPPPRSGFNTGDCLVKSTYLKLGTQSCDFAAAEISDESRIAYDFLRPFAKDYPVIWLNDAICGDGICRSSLDTAFIFRDEGHLSYEGAAALGRKLDFYGAITSLPPQRAAGRD